MLKGRKLHTSCLAVTVPFFHSHAALCSQLQVGNRAFAARFKLECPNSWALVNEQDPVPRVPGNGEPSFSWSMCGSCWPVPRVPSNGELGRPPCVCLGFVVAAFVCLQPQCSRQQQRASHC